MTPGVREDKDTPTVEAAAGYEARREDWPTVRVGGTRIDVDDVPGPDER